MFCYIRLILSFSSLSLCLSVCTYVWFFFSESFQTWQPIIHQYASVYFLKTKIVSYIAKYNDQNRENRIDMLQHTPFRLCSLSSFLPGPGWNPRSHVAVIVISLYSLQPRRVPWSFAFRDLDTFGKKQAGYLVGRLLFGAFLLITLGDALLARKAQKGLCSLLAVCFMDAHVADLPHNWWTYFY